MESLKHEELDPKDKSICKDRCNFLSFMIPRRHSLKDVVMPDYCDQGWDPEPKQGQAKTRI